MTSGRAGVVSKPPKFCRVQRQPPIVERPSPSIPAGIPSCIVYIGKYDTRAITLDFFSLIPRLWDKVSSRSSVCLLRSYTPTALEFAQDIQQTIRVLYVCCLGSTTWRLIWKRLCMCVCVICRRIGTTRHTSHLCSLSR